MSSFAHFGTDAVHAGQDPSQWRSGAVVPPISMSTTFQQKSPGQHAGWDYSRAGNPTRDCLEKAFAALENGKHGLAFGSGLAATMAVLQMLQAGDHVIAHDDLYGGTGRLFRRIASKFGLNFQFVDCRVPENVAEAINPQTRLVWLETPTNPLLQVIDIRAIADAVKRHSNIILVVDNTFMSPYYQRPLDLGADIAFNSVTKYINGHSDVVMGMCVIRDEALAERLKFIQFAGGAVPSPLDCFLVNRGLKTLHVRMQTHQANAIALALYLRNSKKVEEVIYPGLPSHPGYEVMQKQTRGSSGMISFRIKGGLREAKTFLEACKIFTLAESLGAVESLIEHPAIMTHASVPPDVRERLGISDNLIRISVGLEEEADLLADIQQALDAAVAGPTDPPGIITSLKAKFEEEKKHPELWRKTNNGTATTGPKRATIYEAGGVHGRYQATLPAELVHAAPVPAVPSTDRRASAFESGGVHGRYETPFEGKQRDERPQSGAASRNAFESNGIHGRYDGPAGENTGSIADLGGKTAGSPRRAQPPGGKSSVTFG